MDIGRDVLTRTLIGNTDAEKVFTPWWITLHHYLVYFLVVLGKVYFELINCIRTYQVPSIYVFKLQTIMAPFSTLNLLEFVHCRLRENFDFL